MLTLTRTNNTPVARRHGYTPWGFADDFFRPFLDVMNAPMRSGVRETENAFLFDAELPGFSPEEIDVSVLEGVLNITAEHKDGKEDEPAFAARTVRRSFTLENIDEEGITARYQNGVLRITLPKAKAAEAAAARKIPVN